MHRPLISVMLLVAGCAVTEGHDGWWSVVPQNGVRSNAGAEWSLPAFREVRGRGVTGAIVRLQSEAWVVLSPAEAEALAPSPDGKAWRKPFLVRALKMDPADGDFAVTLHEGHLAVNYTAPPSGSHWRERRSALVIDLPSPPVSVSITCGEGVV